MAKSKLIPSLIMILLSSFLIRHISYALSPRPEKQELCRALRIIDGDTIAVLYQGKNERVRLLKINTPEKGHYGFKQSKKAMERLVSGREVRLEFEVPGKLARDGYKRILAYVWVDDMNINVEMVRLGWSRFWTKYGKGKYADEFMKAEREAMEEGRGLWKEHIDIHSMLLHTFFQWYQGINDLADKFYSALKKVDPKLRLLQGSRCHALSFQSALMLTINRRNNRYLLRCHFNLP